MIRKSLQTNLEHLPDCAAEFIKLVIKKMRYRKKVRADVQAELAAHFEDELRDCKNDDEKEQKAQRFIEEFGDAKLLGVLLRRAKKRCRPLWRTVVVRTFQTAGLLIVFFILYLVWFLTGKPVITTNYVAELNHIVRPVADSNLNAAPLYEKAIALFVDPNDYYSNLFHKDYNEVKPEEKQVIKQWITDNNAIFDLLIAGTNKPYYWRQYQGDELISILIPHLSEFKKLALGLCWRVRLQVEQGRYEDAFDDMKSCYRMGRHLRGDKTLIEQLVGITIESLSVETVRNILSRHTVDSGTLAKLQGEFEQIIAGENFIVSLKSEKLFLYDVIQRCFTEDRLGGGHPCIKQLMPFIGYTGVEALGIKTEPWTALLHILFTHPNKQQTREMGDRYYAFLDNMFRKTPAQVRAENIDPEKEAMELIKGNIFLEVFRPVLTKVNTISYTSKIGTQSLIAIIALLRYRQDKSFYPSNLNELITAGYLKDLPMDSFSDKPLVYRKIDDGFTFYSVGRNFADDGGKPGKDRKGRPALWADDCDAVFWPVQK